MVYISITPYLLGIIFFILTYILISVPVYQYFELHCWGSHRIMIALIIGSVAFIAAAALVAPSQSECIPRAASAVAPPQSECIPDANISEDPDI